jgi:hypothetical protein
VTVNSPWRLRYHDCIEIAHLHADTAADTDIRIDDVCEPARPADRVDRAIASAYGTSRAGIRLNLETNQCTAGFSRAAFFKDVRLEFIAEIL